MEKTGTTDTTPCCMNESNLLEADGFIVCTTCGLCQSNIVYKYSSVMKQCLIEKDVIIYDICENGGIPKRTADIANTLFSRLRNQFKKLNSKILQATAVYVSCKQDGYPRTLREISAISGVSTKQIGKYDSIINQKHYDITPDMYVNRFCSKLGKSFHFTKRAQNFAKDLYVKNKSNPISISATAIYLANQSDRKTEKKSLEKFKI